MSISIYPFQKPGVNRSKIVNSSNLPISMRNEDSHLPATGSALHENSGPKLPNPGPILLMLEMTIPSESKKFKSKASRNNVLSTIVSK